MGDLYTYGLKVNAILLACWLVYRLFFYGLTYFQANRLYLLCGILLAFVVPLLPLPSFSTESAPLILNTTFEQAVVHSVDTPAESFSWMRLFLVVWLLGTFLFAGHFLLQLISLGNLWVKSQPACWQRYRYRKLAGNAPPFSFLGFVFLNPAQFRAEEMEYIFRHEAVHVRQGHTFDILLAELVKISCWWNPASWLLKHALQTNLEFIADRQVLKTGACKKTYQLSLLKIIEQHAFRTISTPFSFFKLKARIKMMNGVPSGLAAKFRYLLIVPLIIGLLLSCADAQEVYENVESPEDVLSTIDLSGEDVTYFIDDEQVNADALGKLDHTEIARTMVCKNFDEGKSIKVYTKAYEEKAGIKHTDATPKMNEMLIMVDGKPVSEAELKAISPDKIATVNILKGEQAVAKYGSKAEKGVVEVRLKINSTEKNQTSLLPELGLKEAFLLNMPNRKTNNSDKGTC